MSKQSTPKSEGKCASASDLTTWFWLDWIGAKHIKYKPLKEALHTHFIFHCLHSQSSTITKAKFIHFIKDYDAGKTLPENIHSRKEFDRLTLSYFAHNEDLRKNMLVLGIVHRNKMLDNNVGMEKGWPAGMLCFIVHIYMYMRQYVSYIQQIQYYKVMDVIN